MKPSAALLVSVEGGAAIALMIAAAAGEASLHSNGLHVLKLAHDNIAFTVLAACILSCLIAPVLLASAAESWRRVEAIGFLSTVLIGLLAASAFANASGMTLNGASAEWISWPTTLWLLALLVAFALRACDAHRGTGESNSNANRNQPAGGLPM